MKYEFSVVGDETGWKTVLKLDGKIVHEIEMKKSTVGFKSTEPVKDDLYGDLYELVGDIDGAGHALAMYARENS